MKLKLIGTVILFALSNAYAGPKSLTVVDSNVLFDALLGGGVELSSKSYPQTLIVDTLECSVSANPYNRQGKVGCTAEPNSVEIEGDDATQLMDILRLYDMPTAARPGAFSRYAYSIKCKREFMVNRTKCVFFTEPDVSNPGGFSAGNR